MNKQNRKLFNFGTFFICVGLVSGVALVAILGGLTIKYGLDKAFEKDKEKHYWLQPTTELTNPVEDLKEIYEY